MLEKAVTRQHDNKSLGNDLIVGYWNQLLKFFVNKLTTLFSNTFSDSKANTVLLPKNNDT